MARNHGWVAIVLAAVLLLGGCGRGSPATVVKEWTFVDGPQGWNGGFCDLPVDYDEDMFDLKFEHCELPAELGPGKALRLQGHNRSDDLFMFVSRMLTSADGVRPDTVYSIRFEVDMATSAPAGAVGIGGPPGEAVFVKVGAAAVGPERVRVDEAGTPYYRLNVDKGSQNDDGKNAVRVGDAAKVECDEFDVFEIKTLDNHSAPLEIRSDDRGNLWLFVGTDSGFEGLTVLYYSRIKVTLEPKV